MPLRELLPHILPYKRKANIKGLLRFEVRVGMSGVLYFIDADLTQVKPHDIGEIAERIDQIMSIPNWRDRLGYPLFTHVDWLCKALRCLIEQCYPFLQPGHPIGPKDWRIEDMEVLARVANKASLYFLHSLSISE